MAEQARTATGRFGRKGHRRVDTFNGLSHIPTTSRIETADGRWRRALDPITGAPAGPWNKEGAQ